MSPSSHTVICNDKLHASWWGEPESPVRRTKRNSDMRPGTGCVERTPSLQLQLELRQCAVCQIQRFYPSWPLGESILGISLFIELALPVSKLKDAASKC